MTVKVLWIEGSRTAAPPFVPDLIKKGYRVEMVHTGTAAVERFPELDPDLVVINAASLHTSGQRIYHTLRDLRQDLRILVIHDPSQQNGKVDASQVLVLPFTFRKLLNRIRMLVPENKGQALKAGPIQYFPECQRVKVGGGEAQTLPRILSALLNAFLQHPGEALSREWLLREVWHTTYFGDTRTLDVHIQWLRKKIEPDPHKPQFLKTVRGVGYRLDV